MYGDVDAYDGYLSKYKWSKRYSFYQEWPRLRTGTIDGCVAFERGIHIVGIEGHDVATDGDLALAATTDRCDAGLGVTLSLEDGGTESIPCSEPPAPPPAPLAFPEV